MDEVSRGRTVFGRLLTALGFVWLFWSLFGDLVTFELGTTPINLPLLPGLVFLFVGRALSRGARRRVDPAPAEQQRPATTVPRPAPRSVEPSPSPSRPTYEAPMPIVEQDQVAIEEVMTEAMEAELQRISDGTEVRKTSAEMVAEARQRFGKRP